MPVIKDNRIEEPAVATGSSVMTVAGALSLVLFFFPELLNERQQTVVLVLSAFLLPIITALLTRRYVWSPASVQRLIDNAVAGARREVTKALEREQFKEMNRGTDKELG